MVYEAVFSGYSIPTWVVFGIQVCPFLVIEKEYSVFNELYELRRMKLALRGHWIIDRSVV